MNTGRSIQHCRRSCALGSAKNILGAYLYILTCRYVRMEIYWVPIRTVYVYIQACLADTAENVMGAMPTSCLATYTYVAVSEYIILGAYVHPALQSCRFRY